MSERVRLISHKGEQILFSDYSGLDEEPYLRELDETIVMLKSAIAKRPSYLLALTNVSNTTTTAKITQKSKECTTLLKGVKATTAIVGITKTKKVIANIVSPDLQMFDTVDKAKDWLAAEARRRRAY